MTWWLRLILALVLGPILWRLVGLYLEANQGGDLGVLLQGLSGSLAQAYRVGTLPALALIVIILIPASFALRLLGLDLLIVGLAPLIAWLVPMLLVKVVRDEHVGAFFDFPAFAVAYGFVWGLTLREPPRHRDDSSRWTDAAFQA